MGDVLRAEDVRGEPLDKGGARGVGAATGMLQGRNSVETRVTNLVHLTSWTGNVRVLNEYSVVPPSPSTLAVQANCTIHFGGIVDPGLTRNTIATALDSKCMLSALGSTTDPAGGDVDLSVHSRFVALRHQL